MYKPKSPLLLPLVILTLILNLLISRSESQLINPAFLNDLNLKLLRDQLYHKRDEEDPQIRFSSFGREGEGGDRGLELLGPGGGKLSGLSVSSSGYQFPYFQQESEPVIISNEEEQQKIQKRTLPGPSGGVNQLPLCCTHNNECFNNLGSLSSSSSSGEPSRVYFKKRNWVVPKAFVSIKRSTKFRLVNSSLFCKYPTLSVILPLVGPLPSSPSFSRNSRNSYFTPEGYLKYNHEYYGPSEYCISGLNENKVEFSICPANCSDPLTPCIQKCCGIGQLYSFGYGENPRGCIDVGDGDLSSQWTPTLYHDLHRKLSDEEVFSLRPHIIHRFPTMFKFNCRFNKTTVFPHGPAISEFLTGLTGKVFRNLEFGLRKDGFLLYPGGNEEEGTNNLNNVNTPVAKKIENYCIDGAVDYGEAKSFSNKEEETILFLCSGGVDEAFETPTSSPPQDENLQLPPLPQTTMSPPPVLRKPGEMTIPMMIPERQVTTPPPHLKNFKDHFLHNPKFQILEKDNKDISSSASLEIEIEDGVPINSVESRRDNLVPAVLKIAVEMPSRGRGNGQKIEKRKETILTTDDDIEEDNPSLPFIPSCCDFDPSINDGQTHHCRNHNQLNNETLTNNPTPTKQQSVRWMVPSYFTTRSNSITPMRLLPKSLSCGPGKFQFQGFIHDFDQINKKNSGEKKHGILVGDGWLKYDQEFYSQEEYCVNGLSPKILELLICKPDCSMWETPCIQKCCGMDEVYNLGLVGGGRGCQPLLPRERRFNPSLYKGLSSPPIPPEEMKRMNIHPHFVQKYPPTFQQKCYNNITLAFPYSKEVAERLRPKAASGGNNSTTTPSSGSGFKHLLFRFRKDGKLMYSFPESDGTTFDAVYDRPDYCVDAIRDYGEQESERDKEKETILFICATEPQPSKK